MKNKLWQKTIHQKISLVIMENNPHQEILSPLFFAKSKSQLTRSYRVLLRNHLRNHLFTGEMKQEITQSIIATYLQLLPQLI